VKTKTSLVAGVVGILAILAGSSYASPYWTMHRMQASIDDKDVRAFSRDVDLAALRHNVEVQFRTALQGPIEQVAAQMQQNGATNAKVEAWRKLVPIDALIQQIDAQVSIANIASVMATGEASQTWPARSEPAARDLALSYRDWNQVVFTPRNETEGHGLIFQRTGLWSWKLVDLNFETRAAVQ
jgi:hypothetical protein